MIVIEMFEKKYYIDDKYADKIAESMRGDKHFGIVDLHGDKAIIKPNLVSSVHKASEKEEYEANIATVSSIMELPPPDDNFTVERNKDMGDGRTAQIGINKYGDRVVRTNYKW